MRGSPIDVQLAAAKQVRINAVVHDADRENTTLRAGIGCRQLQPATVRVATYNTLSKPPPHQSFSSM
jgi:hypothetical protein